MRFVFSLVTNVTYSLFCVSIQYVILYFYKMLFFSSLYMLSLSLVVFSLYSTIFLYVLCIFLLVTFDADTFRSQNDIMLETNNGHNDISLLLSASDLQDDINQDDDGRGDNSNDTSTLKSSNAKVVYNDFHVDALITFLLCHITVFLSVFVVFAIGLYECITKRQSVICRFTYGLHSANNAIGIAMLLLTFSVLLPLLSLYKLNAGNSHVFHTHMPTFVVMFTCLTHLAIVSKIQFYSMSCPLLISFSGSLAVVYCTIAMHFVFRGVDIVIYFCVNHFAHHSYHAPPRGQPAPDSIYSTFFLMIVNTILLLANLAYAWSISGIFNIIQSIVIVLYILAMAHRIIKLPTIRYARKRIRDME